MKLFYGLEYREGLILTICSESTPIFLAAKPASKKLLTAVSMYSVPSLTVMFFPTFPGKLVRIFSPLRTEASCTSSCWNSLNGASSFASVCLILTGVGSFSALAKCSENEVRNTIK